MKDQTFELIKDSLNEIKSDISVIKRDNSEIMNTMVINTQSLGEHMRRTEALEKHVEILEGSINEVKVFASRYDVFIKILKSIPIVVIVTFTFTVFMWVNISEESKEFLIKFLTNTF